MEGVRRVGLEEFALINANINNIVIMVNANHVHVFINVSHANLPLNAHSVKQVILTNFFIHFIYFFQVLF